MKNSFELFTMFHAFCDEIQTQFNVPICTLHSDNVEYFPTSFKSFIIEHDIIYETSCVLSAFIKMGWLKEIVDTYLELPMSFCFKCKQFWVDFVSTTCYLINRLPSSILNGQIPYILLFPSQSLFVFPPRIFGWACFVQDVRS